MDFDRAVKTLAGYLRSSGAANLGLGPEIALALFLARAADDHGYSYYREERIAEQLGIDVGKVQAARRRLVSAGLIAFAAYDRPSIIGFHRVRRRLIMLLKPPLQPTQSPQWN